jgi:hypothetical protein
MTQSAVRAQLGTPDSETDMGIAYMDWSYAASLLCVFDEQDKLESYVFMVKTSYTSELTEFLLERYIPATLPDDGDIIAIFVNGLNANTTNMAVALGIYNLSYLMVMYHPFPVTGTRSAVDRSDIMNSIDEIMSRLSIR